MVILFCESDRQGCILCVGIISGVGKMDGVFGGLIDYVLCAGLCVAGTFLGLCGLSDVSMWCDWYLADVYW